MKKIIVVISAIIALVLFFIIINRKESNLSYAVETAKDGADAAQIENYERIEPFKLFYEDSILDTVCFEGTVRMTSNIPDPKTNDYDNCLYALFLELESVISNSSLIQQIPCEAPLPIS